MPVSGHLLDVLAVGGELQAACDVQVGLDDQPLLFVGGEDVADLCAVQEDADAHAALRVAGVVLDRADSHDAWP